ncbi:DUF6894 family protein [Bradyrhizobium sp. RDM4]
MPRYYFRILDGTSTIDETGVELADLRRRQGSRP